MNDLAVEMDRAAAIMETMAYPSEWSGTATDLLGLMRGPIGQELPDIPTSRRGISNRLQRLAPQLRAHGLDAQLHKSTEWRSITDAAGGPPTGSMLSELRQSPMSSHRDSKTSRM